MRGPTGRMHVQCLLNQTSWTVPLLQCGAVSAVYIFFPPVAVSCIQCTVHHSSKSIIKQMHIINLWHQPEGQ